VSAYAGWVAVAFVLVTVLAYGLGIETGRDLERRESKR